jgi:IS605 OrfB family transposase
MIISTKVTNKFANTHRLADLYTFINEYRNVVKQFVDLLWDQDKISTLLPKETTKQVNTWLSARMVQCAGKQASGIVRGTKKKQNKRLYVINKLKEEGKFKQARKLQAIYDKNHSGKPNINEVEPELDSRFIKKLDMDNDTSFDGYITLYCIGNKMEIMLPFKKNKHFNKLESKGQIKTGVRLNKKNLTFMFDIPEPQKQVGTTIGIDIGKCETLSCSNGFQTTKNKHGHDLNSILNRMSRKKKGSKAFQREEAHRTNYINWSINQLNLNNVGEVRIERIKNMRKGRRSSRMLSHWTYTDIFGKLESRCEEHGVHVKQVNPTYTSQRCSKCGWTRKSNRKGKQFKCGSCGYTCDSDLNASVNISLDLKPIGRKERLLNKNRTGFYWSLTSEEHIVPRVQETKDSDFL